VSRPGPPRTGTVEPFKRVDGTTYYRARITLGDDSRVRVDVPEKYCTPIKNMTARQRAELYAEARQEQEDEDGKLLAEKRAREAVVRAKHDETHGETCEKYFGRFLVHRGAIGKVRRVRDLKGAWDTWISPKLGPKPIASITREDVEDVRDALDEEVARRKIEGGTAGLSGARARNVWSVLTSMMKEACTSKRRDLRVRGDNPCTTVQPPDKSDARAKTFIYPTEFLALVSCEDVPLAWRELYAVACYLYLRPGELRALAWTDVDFAAGVVHITKAYDEDSRTVKAPKTRNGVRDVPIPSELVPLLKAIHARTPLTDGATLVIPFLGELNENRRAGWMRKHLAIAKLNRARLTEQSATTMQVNFRSWRDTGITWLALQGVDVAKMQRRAGHDSISTTLSYVKMAEDLSGTIGEPFPPLPEALLKASAAASGPQNLAKHLAKLKDRTKNLGKMVGEAGFEPATTSTQSSCTTGLCDSPRGSTLAHVGTELGGSAMGGGGQRKAGEVMIAPSLNFR
jgi:integrase